MAVTTTYSISNVINEFTANTFTNGNQGNSSVAVLADGDFIVTYDDTTAQNAVLDDHYDNDGVHAPGNWDLVNSTTTGDQKDSETAALNNGGYVVVYEDESISAADGSIRFRRFNEDGVAQGADVNVGFGGFDELDPSVATLSDGRFVISWRLNNSISGLGEIYRAVYTENGVFQSRTNVTSGSLTVNHFETDVAALTDGGYVVTWSEDDTAIIGFNSNLRARIYNANNTVRTTITLDSIGTQNRASDVIGMSDGRWAVVYHDNGWGIDENEITMRLYNPNGSTSSGFIRVNTVTNNDQTQAKITELGNGFLLVTWTREFTDGGVDLDIRGRVYDATGPGNPVAVTGEFTIEGSLGNQFDSDVDGFLNGRFMVTYTDNNTSPDDGNGGHIGAQLSDLVRTSTSDGASDTIVGDTFRDVMNGNGGNDFLDGRGNSDTLNGGSGNDRLKGGNGDDFLDGGADNDTAVYTGGIAVSVSLNTNLAQNTVGRGIDTLVNIENLVGSSAGDFLGGNAGINVLKGVDGNDILSGLGSRDILIGGLGNDILIGGDGSDIQKGNSNNDFIIGGLGRDIALGGFGIDTFDYNSTAESGPGGANRDKIKDFAVGIDKIDVSTIDANTGVLGNQAFVLDTGGAFIAGEIRQIVLATKTLLQFNTDGDAAPEMEIILTNQNFTALSAGDFVL